MTRDEKIERTAVKYSEGNPNAILIYRAFKDGVRYADNHPVKKPTIWHDVQATPKENSKIAIVDIEGNIYNYIYKGNENWEQVVETNDIVIWAYLDDFTDL